MTIGRFIYTGSVDNGTVIVYGGHVRKDVRWPQEKGSAHRVDITIRVEAGGLAQRCFFLFLFFFFFSVGDNIFLLN